MDGLESRHRIFEQLLQAIADEVSALTHACQQGEAMSADVAEFFDRSHARLEESRRLLDKLRESGGQDDRG